VPYGGLARRATLINAARDEHANLLVLDAGNTFWSQSGLAAKSQGKVIAEAMNLIGYNAMTLGEVDLQLGEDVLRQRIADALFPVLSANVVVQSTGQLLARPYALLDVGGRKVGVIGLTGSGSVEETAPQPPAPGGTPPAPEPESATPGQASGVARPAAPHVIGTLAITDPLAALTTYLKEVQARTNIVIVLSNLGWDANQSLAETVPGIDLIVSGGTGKILTQPWQAPTTGTLVCQVGLYPQAHPGQVLANVQMHIDGAGIVVEFKGSDAALGTDLDDEPRVRKLLDDYQLK
jgi:2',3'-cyclic-nucleotide 2'-phosphodiesterase (5'-nucleotidase family)